MYLSGGITVFCLQIQSVQVQCVYSAIDYPFVLKNVKTNFSTMSLICLDNFTHLFVFAQKIGDIPKITV
jgi:hypothetical protein